MNTNWKTWLYKTIFEEDTPAGRRFDILLLWLIMLSVFVVVLESIPILNEEYTQHFFIIESIFTSLFTIEYILRVMVYPKPAKYITSVWGIIDLLSILPFYMSLLSPEYHYFIVLRLFRLLRVFRILKLFRFISESQYLYNALKSSSYKIGVFITGVLTIVVLLGTVMYVVEGPKNGFTSIPESIYWTIVTITTVGYGDITPQTYAGKIISSLVMLCGYAIIAVPTGIVTVEMSRQRDGQSKKCTRCGHYNISTANYCNSCGQELENKAA